MFKDRELSARGGKPVHLFLFGRQMLAWRYTSGARDITIAGNTYAAAPIVRTAIKETLEKPQDQITITFPYSRDPDAAEIPVTQPLGDNWHPYIPTDRITVMCMTTHLGDPDAQATVDWQGIAAQPKITDGQIALTCVPNRGAGAHQGNGPKWQTSCWKTPYSTGVRGCNMKPVDFDQAATLTAVAGVTVTAPEFAGVPLALDGGKLYWTRDDGLIESRDILAHAGATLTLLYGAPSLAAGLAVTARPSCPRTWAACEARHNTLNYGGAIYKPVKNPYDGQSMSWG